GKVASVVMQYRRERSDLADSGLGFRIGAEVVIETPAANGFTNRKHLRGALRIRDAGEHAIGCSEMLRQHERPLVAHGCEPDEIVSAIHHRRCLPVNRPVPDAFTLHMRIELEHGSWRWGRRIAQVDTVAVFIAAEAELEAGNIPICKSLDPVNSLTNTSRN